MEMTTLEPELQALRENLLEMMDLVTDQLTLCRKMLVNADAELAKEVDAYEKRVNSLELAVDDDCENILALHNPVAVDLRFVLASLKIGNDLERIGDNAKSLSKFLANNISKKKARRYADEFELRSMLDLTIEMMKGIRKAVEEKDAGLALKTLKRDKKVNEYSKEAMDRAEKFIHENPGDTRLLLRFLTTVRRLERVGDMIKNIGEEVVFHVDARVIKHSKKAK